MGRSGDIVLCAGELSGDMHAAHVVVALSASSGARVTGMAGDRCRQAGMELRFDHRDYAVIGFTGVLAGLPRFLRLEREMKRLIDRAALFIAVDYPGLNLRLCAHAHARGVPVLYYIAPQVWAWGRGRVQKMKRTVDQVAVVLPFETEIYRDAGIPVEFVGHPFVVDHELPPPATREREGIALLPGSRQSEVRTMLPVMLAAAARMAATHPDVSVTIARSPVVAPEVYQSIVTGSPVPVRVAPDVVDVLAHARVAIVASGTATLQSALMETPLVVVYKTSPLNYALARRLVTIPNVGLVNVLLGEQVAPELVQGRATPGAVALAAGRLLEDEPLRGRTIARFRSLREGLGGGRGAVRVAELARALIAGDRTP
jgi:lipid-A-disaccharide synthase